MEASSNEPARFGVGPTKVNILSVLALAAAAAGAGTWFFRGGMYTAGVVVTLVFLPLLALYWYILYVSPKSTAVLVGEEAVVVKVPPYFTETVLAGAVHKAYLTDLREDAHLAIKAKTKGTAMGGYLAGIFEGESGKEIVAAANSRKVVCLVTNDKLLALGPDDLEGLVRALSERMRLSVS